MARDWADVCDGDDDQVLYVRTVSLVGGSCFELCEVAAVAAGSSESSMLRGRGSHSAAVGLKWRRCAGCQEVGEWCWACPLRRWCFGGRDAGGTDEDEGGGGGGGGG